jgi:hypothetical protein
MNKIVEHINILSLVFDCNYAGFFLQLIDNFSTTFESILLQIESD